jgi:hypothetical protein
MPPALGVIGVSLGRWQRSTHQGRFSDEPFGVRDIQFDCPRIFVEPCSPREEIGNFGGTGRFGRADGLPAIGSVGGKHTLETSDVMAAATDQQKHRTALGVTAPDYCGEITGRGNSADDGPNLDVSREPLAH